MKEIYISTDVETDGPIPGPNSMLSLGAAAYTADKKLLGTFSCNFDTLPMASGDPDTMAWWQTQPEAWAACRKDTVPPSEGIHKYVEWIESFKGYKPVFVAYPAGFDFLFVYWYLVYFVGKSPFSFSAVDVKTLAWAVMGGNYRDVSKKSMPKHWKQDLPNHTHVAVDDAIEQGLLFCHILEALREARS